MTEQARPFKDIDLRKIETLDAPEIPRARPAKASASTVEEAEATRQERSVLDRLIAGGWVNWETLIWLGIMALTIFMHLIDLGPKAMHHDESIHAKFTYDWIRGVNSTGAVYDPTWHGPLLYNMVALCYFLFGGATETTARLAPAFYGIALVGICYLLRPVIGRIGALAMGLFVMFSPTILYYGRSLRHDIFATAGELLFVVGLFRFMQLKPGYKSWWLPVSGLGLIILYASHEMVFLNGAILVAWLGVAFLFEVVTLPAWIKNRTAAERETLHPTPETVTENSHIPESVAESDHNSESVAESVHNSENVAEPELWENRQPELAAEGLKEDAEHGRVGDPVLGNWGRLGLVLFILGAIAVVWGSAYLFKTPEGGEAPTAFGVPQWLLTIPVGLLGALALAYSLGGFVAYGYSRLEAKNVLVSRLVMLASIIVLGTLAVFSALRTKAPDNTDKTPIPIVNGSPLSSTDAYLFGMYVLPRIVFNILLVVIATLLISVIVAWLWQRRFLVYTEKGLYGAGVVFFAFMLITSLVSLRFILVSTQPLPKGNLFLVGPEVDKWQAYLFNGFFLAAAVAAFAGWLVSLADRIDDSELAGSAVLRGVLRVARQPWALAGFIAVFGVIYILLFSTWFFNLPGLADGFYRGIEYWVQAHGQRRLDEPWYYYPFIMLLYEIVPVVFAFAALFTFPVIFLRRTLIRGRCRFTVRGLFIGYTLWWAALAMLAYSIAGEKAPWLNMQIALPTMLAAAAFLDFYVRRIPWREFWGWTKGPLFAGLFVLLFGAVCVVIGLFINLPQDSNLRNQQLVEALVVILVGLMIFAGCFWLWWTRRISGRVARAAIVLVATIALSAYTIKSTIALNYLHPDTADEMLVYVQTTPELPLFVQRLDRLSRDLRDTYKTTPPPAGTTQPDPTNSKGLPVLLTNEVAWPLEWYLRDYTDKNYFTPDNAANNNPAIPNLQDSRGNNYVVIAVSEAENQAKLQQQLQGQYTPHTYKFRWWFPGESTDWQGLGKDLTNTNWGMMLRSFTEQPMAGRMWRFIMYRELWQPLDSFNMVVYVRNDIDPNWGLYEGGNPAGEGSPQAGDQGQQAFGLFESSQPGNRNGQFKTPRDIAVAPNGDIYVLDSENARVQHFDKDGKFLSKFGSPGKGDGQFALAQYNSGPSGITIDEDGNIYVADSWNYRIEKFDKDGKFLLKWGDGKDTGGDPAVNQQFPNFFYGPRELAYDPTHKELYVADTGNQRIVVFDKQGQYIRQFGSKGNGNGLFSEPIGVALNSDGTKVYVSDLRNKRVQILDPKGQYISEIKIPYWNDQQPISEPYVKLDKQDNLFVTDPTNGRVYKFDKNGAQLNVYDSTKGFFLTNPVGLAFDSEGNLLVTDAKRNAVVKIPNP